MLLINPLYLWNTSFQLSFTGVAAVITAARLTEKNKELNKVGKSILVVDDVVSASHCILDNATVEAHC